MFVVAESDEKLRVSSPSSLLDSSLERLSVLQRPLLDLNHTVQLLVAGYELTTGEIRSFSVLFYNELKDLPTKRDSRTFRLAAPGPGPGGEE